MNWQVIHTNSHYKKQPIFFYYYLFKQKHDDIHNKTYKRNIIKRIFKTKENR